MMPRSERTPGRAASQGRYLAQLMLVFALGGALLLPGYIEVFPENIFGAGYGRWRSQLDFVDRPDLEPEVLIAGDSRAQAALLPERLGPRVRSIAIGGATSIETYYLLHRYLTRNPPPRLLLLSLAPFHFGKADVFWERTAKWKALRTPEALEVFRRAAALGDAVLGEPDFRSLTLRWGRLRLNYVGDYAAELRNSRGRNRRARNRSETERVAAARGHTFFGRETSSSQPGQEVWEKSGFRSSPLLDAYLRDTLVLATRHGVRVVFAAMPLNHRSWRALETDYLEGYNRHVARLAAEHPDVAFRGFLWTLPDDHFGDASHVNARGARLVSDWLAPLL
jgi:hypothetical protein